MIKVLVVDDDHSAQKVLHLFLQKSGYIPIIQPDGRKVVDIVLADDPPQILIVDWMMPNIDGTDLCKKLREAKPKERPYIIMLSSKSNKEDVAAGLDAGADDFVSKPFNVLEMQARLRVACRTIEYQRELKRQTDDNEILNQRNNLLSELISRKPGSAPAVAAAVNPATGLPKTESFKHFTDHEIRFLLSATFLELHLALNAVRPRAGRPDFLANDYSSWGALVLTQQNTWIDLVFTAKPGAAQKLFIKSLGRSPTGEADLLALWAEIARRIAQCILRTLKLRCGETTQPLMTRSVILGIWHGMPSLPSDVKTYDLGIDGHEVSLCVMASNESHMEIAPEQLSEMDVLADQYPSRASCSVPLFREEVVLTQRFIDRIKFHSEHTRQGGGVSVYRPTPVSKYYTPRT